MTRSRDRLAAALLALSLVATATSARADDPAVAEPARVRQDADLMRLGDHFYDRQQYYRAVGVFEELALFTDDEDVRVHARLRIAMSYHHGGQLDDAVAAYDDTLASPTLVAPDAGWVRLQRSLARADRALADSRREASDVVAAELTPLMTDPDAPYATLAGYHVARVRLLAGDRAGARQARDTVAARCVARPLDDCAVLAQFDAALARATPRQRSPLLAVTLSALVPGLGSVYSQHYVDGLYYAGLTTLAALGAWDVHDPDRGFGEQTASFYGLGVLAVVTYGASLIQAYVGARRFNAVEQLRWRTRVLQDTDRGLPLEHRPAHR